MEGLDVGTSRFSQGPEPGPAVGRNRRQADPEPLASPKEPLASPKRWVPHHLLICLDRSSADEGLIRHATALARVWSAHVTLLHVLELDKNGGSLAPIDALRWRLLREEARRFLDNAVSSSAVGDLRIEAALAEGRVFEQVQAWTHSHDVDLTVLATHGRAARSDCTGSDCGLAGTAYKLIEGSQGSLLIVPSPTGGARNSRAGAASYRRILVPLDGSLHAASAVPLAAQVAESYGSEIILAHVLPEPGLVRIGPPEAEDLALEQSMIRRNEKVVTRYLASVRAQLRSAGIRARTHLSLKEGPRDGLLRMIDEERIGLVVLSAHGSTGATHRPLGSVAAHLVAHAKAPLLITRERTRCTAVWDRASSVAHQALPRLPSAAA